MSAPVRARSPLAHGPDTHCRACRDCPSCDGHTRPIPRQYRVHIHPTGEATARCTQCHGTGTACLNLIGATP